VKVTKIIKKYGLNDKHIDKCLSFYPFWLYYQVSPTVLEIVLRDNIERLKGNKTSMPASVDREIIRRFTIDELETFLELISHKEIEVQKEINHLFCMFCL